MAARHHGGAGGEKLRAVDLFCGMGGWTRGLQDEGFKVFGFDLERMPYSGALVLQDIRTLSGERMRGKIDLIVASPPCQQFSALRLPWRRSRLKYTEPDLSLVMACYRIAIEAEAPLVLENVAGAVPWIGPYILKAGPYYLWGDGVPPLVPLIGPCKTNIREPPSYGRNHPWRSALRAIIPYELARAVGAFHRRRLTEGICRS